MGKKSDKKSKVATVAVPTEIWKTIPDDHDYPAAASYLGLCTDPDTAQKLADTLKAADIVHHPAKDLLRASHLSLLPKNDPAVQRDLDKVSAGEKLSPVLIIRGVVGKGVPALIADGYHRVCASYYLSENEQIPCRIIDGIS
ncbi:MAG: hypothetical protein RL205_1270 [Actinomycetota bacterium]|jgi:hypothetical protein